LKIPHGYYHTGILKCMHIYTWNSLPESSHCCRNH